MSGEFLQPEQDELGSSLDVRLGANLRLRPGIATTASWDSKTVFSEIVNSRKEF